MLNQIFTLRALSPVHCGIGQGLNDIDLPTARNSVSGHPIVPASSIKGVLKDGFLSNGSGNNTGNDDWEETVISLFGGDGSSEFASAISVGDANLLALPVRSFFGTFAYLASPFTLQQLKTLNSRIGNAEQMPAIPTIGLSADNGNYKALITENSLLKQTNHNSILLEEMDLLIDNSDDLADQWADIIAPLFFKDEEGQNIFKKRFCIVDDNCLNFCCESGLPVDARIAINKDTGTVKDGALWYEETIPPESLFSGVMGVDHSYNSKHTATAEELTTFLTAAETIYCQIGGKATTGKGFVAVKFSLTKGA
ncbi:MAG: type III-B CRISPR module RAMP protein Cmr4 [Desulfobacteraceae bacterium]|jgi:CRISPR-associated protein Cmr4|nr:type III-B CRISPR module RAMP protein Cmr4 [Desulfobacteraceae bacterium]